MKVRAVAVAMRTGLLIGITCVTLPEKADAASRLQLTSRAQAPHLRPVKRKLNNREVRDRPRLERSSPRERPAPAARHRRARGRRSRG
jgi:hypothetical protein